jgi:uncharacterized protein (DUF3084 family)
MAVDERRRSHPYERLAASVGEEAAATMFELLPPAGTQLATDARLDRLQADIDHRFAATDARIDQLRADMDHRFAAVDARFDRVDERFEEVDRRFQEVDHRFDRLDARMEAIATDVAGLRGELTNAVAGQTRALLLGVITTVVGIGALTFSFDRFL